MPITCADIFANIEHEVIGDSLAPISGIAFDSRMVQPGDAFFCVVGTESDGHAFAQAAVDAGASVIVCQHQPELADPHTVTQVHVEDARRALAEAAAAFYGYPSQGMDVIGVTGTNGKTTVTYLIEAMLQAAHHPCGVIGTCGSRACGNPIPSLHTTPESADLQRILALMRNAGCQAVAMEVSSHALSLGRPWATRFAVTAFTNITHDHLDYHHTLEEYFEAKKLLFSEEYPAIRVISTLGEGGRALEAACREAGDEVIAVGERPEDDIRLVSSQRVGVLLSSPFSSRGVSHRLGSSSSPIASWAASIRRTSWWHWVACWLWAWMRIRLQRLWLRPPRLQDACSRLWSSLTSASRSM